MSGEAASEEPAFPFACIEKQMRRDKFLHDDHIPRSVDIIRHGLDRFHSDQSRRESGDFCFQDLEDKIVGFFNLITCCYNGIAGRSFAGVVESRFAGNFPGARENDGEKRLAEVGVVGEIGGVSPGEDPEEEPPEDDCVREAAAVYGAKKQGEYTLEDYFALPDDQRVELIDGARNGVFGGPLQLPVEEREQA